MITIVNLFCEIDYQKEEMRFVFPVVCTKVKGFSFRTSRRKNTDQT